MSDLAYWVALSTLPSFGPKTFEKLERFFDSMETAYKADRNQLITAGLRPKQVDAFLHARDSLAPNQLLEQTKRAGVHIVTKQDDTYPRLLKEIYDPPAVLYVKGALPSTEVAHVAVVGSRKATAYGLHAARDFSQALAQAGVVVVSGLAYGIDEAAHTATIKGKGVTVGVLACGHLTLSSRQKYIADAIVNTGGAVVSEFPLHTHALKHFFPTRNRIIAGMSHGTFIVEAAEKSGSLITARAALEQGRDVFALPGPITSETSTGTNNLLKMGAHVATEPSDILDVLQVEHVVETKPKPKPDSKEEAALLELLSKNPIHIDELTRTTQLPPATVAGTLSLMEMKGRTRQIGGMYYILT